MFKASVKMLFMRQASALQSARLSSRPNTGQQRNVGRYFLKKCHKVVTKRDDLLILVLMPSKSQTPFGKEVELTCSQQPHISRF